MPSSFDIKFGQLARFASHAFGTPWNREMNIHEIFVIPSETKSSPPLLPKRLTVVRIPDMEHWSLFFEN